MKQFPRIETERLILSEIQVGDLPLIVMYASNEKITDNTLNIPEPYSDKDAVFWLNLANQGFRSGAQFIFAIRLKNSEEFIGGIGLTIESRFSRAEIGYWLAEPFWNQGMMTEATQAVMQFGFDILNLNKLTATHIGRNPASGKVMIKCGMVKEGELKEHVCKGDVFHDLVLYGITRQQYAQMKRAVMA